MKLHRKVAGLFGYELIKKRKLNDTIEQHLSTLLPMLEVNCVVDVGANTGQFGAMLRGIGYAGRIVSFEPLGSAFSELQARSQSDEKWLTQRLALGRAPGSMTMHRYQSPDFSSFRQPNAFAKRRFLWHVEPSGEEQVDVHTLDECWHTISEGILEPHLFLKPVSRDKFSLAVIEIDCVLRRPERSRERPGGG